MKRMKDESSNSSFYYMAGLCVGRYYGQAPIEFRQKVVSKFKEWVDARAGSDPLPTDQHTIKYIVQKFIVEFERREYRGKQRY